MHSTAETLKEKFKQRNLYAVSFPQLDVYYIEFVDETTEEIKPDKQKKRLLSSMEAKIVLDLASAIVPVDGISSSSARR